jgi:NFU1 iron-sulfur cluster scaffold homolog, mitochondrial
MFIQTEPTPNPNALKFKSTSKLVGDGSVWYDIDLAVKSNDFIRKLFRVAGVRYILLQNDEVTVTKFPQWGWPEISNKIRNVLETDHFFIENGDKDQYCTDEICCAVRKIVQEEIRPAVQLDGGDIKFLKYENGVVEISMHGSCWGCPNNEATLGAISNKLASRIPEVKQVRIV